MDISRFRVQTSEVLNSRKCWMSKLVQHFKLQSEYGEAMEWPSNDTLKKRRS